MQDELEIEDLAVTVDPAACVEVSRSTSAMVKATTKTVTDMALLILSHL